MEDGAVIRVLPPILFLVMALFGPGARALAENAGDSLQTSGSRPRAQDFYYVDAQKLSFSKRLTLASLQALANQDAPRLFVLDRPQDAFWLTNLEKELGVKSRPLSLEEALGAFATNAPQVIYDPGRQWSLSIASTLAGVHQALLSDHPLDRPVAFDCHHHWTNKVEAYRWAISELLPKCRNDQFLFLDEVLPMMRDYGIQQKLFTLNLDPLNNPEDIRLLESILDKFPAQTKAFGWATGAYAQASKGQDGGAVEGAIVARLSAHGMMLVPSDFCANLSFNIQTRSHVAKLSQSHLQRTLKYQKGKRYVLLVYSDGDNLQYDLGTLVDRFQDDRPKIPVAWTISPQLAELAPAVLQTFYRQAAERGGWDEFVSGPSGCAYANPGNMSAAQLDRFVRSTRQVCDKADLSSVVILDPARSPARVDSFIRAYAACDFSGLWLAAMPPYLGASKQTAYASERLRLLGHQNAAEIARHIREDHAKNPFFMIYVGAWETTGNDLREFSQGLDESCVLVSPTEMADLIRQWIAGDSKLRQIEARPNSFSGLTPMGNPDGEFTLTDHAGVPCWRVPKHKTPNYLYFDVDDDFRCPSVVVELEYFAGGLGEVTLEYDSTDSRLPDAGAFKLCPSRIRRTNQAQWQTARFNLNDASFSGRQNGGADFRFYNGGDDLLIRAVRVRRAGP